jgi:hypothetical protein
MVEVIAGFPEWECGRARFSPQRRGSHREIPANGSEDLVTAEADFLSRDDKEKQPRICTDGHGFFVQEVKSKPRIARMTRIRLWG